MPIQTDLQDFLSDSAIVLSVNDFRSANRILLAAKNETKSLGPSFVHWFFQLS